MEEFLKDIQKFRDVLNEYGVEIVTTILAISSLFFMGYKVYYEPLNEYSKDISKMEKEYKDRITKTKKAINERQKQSNTETNILGSIPDLLLRINDTCRKSEIVIRSIEPKDGNQFKYTVNFIANYLDFLYVLSELEKLNVSIDDIQVQPYEINKDNPKHFISITITAIEGGEKLSEENVEFLDEELSKDNKRNPFQRFAKLEDKEIKAIIDLTWIYKLSSIGKSDGKNTATIEHNRYMEKDKFKDMTIVDITPDFGVKLKKEGEKTTYVIRFREINLKTKGE